MNYSSVTVIDRIRIVGGGDRSVGYFNGPNKLKLAGDVTGTYAVNDIKQLVMMGSRVIICMEIIIVISICIQCLFASLDEDGWMKIHFYISFIFERNFSVVLVSCITYPHPPTPGFGLSRGRLTD